MRPAEMPVRTNFGVTITRNVDETAPAKNCATEVPNYKHISKHYYTEGHLQQF
jgi:hypothetical protein